MTFLQVPLRNDLPWYKFRATFSGVIFTVHMRFNTRMNRWIMDLNDPSDNPILIGIPVLISRNLTGQYATIAVPVGTLFATDDSNQDSQPTLYSFGLDHSMFYADPTQ